MHGNYVRWPSLPSCPGEYGPRPRTTDVSRGDVGPSLHPCESASYRFDVALIAAAPSQFDWYDHILTMGTAEVLVSMNLVHSSGLNCHVRDQVKEGMHCAMLEAVGIVWPH